MTVSIFSCERDREIIAAGGFFCIGCLIGKPASEQSSNPRYCQSCREFLLKEELSRGDSGTGLRPHRMPKKAAKMSFPTPCTEPIMSYLTGGKKINLGKVKSHQRRLVGRRVS